MKMKEKAIYILLLLVAMTLGAKAQNTISVAHLTGGQGKDVMIPISMDNNEDVVALQFDLQLPFAKTSGKQPTLTNRNTNGHTVSVRGMGSNRYRVVIVNMSNKPIAGSGGVLLNFPMTVPTGLNPESVHAITLSDVVITNRNGDNIQTGSTNGSYTIPRAPSPDLEVSDVAIRQTTLTPGERISVSWKVSNVGNADTRSGWTEKVYLVNTETEEAVYIGNVYFNNTMLQGGHTARSAEFVLSQTVGVDGEVAAKVVVEPNSNTGEYATDRLNNTAIGGKATVGKMLFLTAPATRLKEGQSMRLQLKRSGNRATDETYSVATSLPDHVSVTTQVTIRAGQSTATFDVTVPDNDYVNSYKAASVTVTKAHGYPADVAVSFDIEDNELLPLSLQLDKSEYNEGESIKLRVSVPYRIEGEELTVSLSIEKPRRFRLPQTFTFPAGATEAVIDIPIVQDNLPANDETIKIIVSADHHLTASTLFILHDDDVPAISMTLQPTTVSEAAGYNAVYATITRNSAVNSKITLKLSDDSNNELYYTQTITMNEGVEEVTFPIGVKDNQKVDGTRTVKFTAAVYITDCGCSAIGNKQTTVTETITITDNDGPTLNITSDKTTILEGDATGAQLTISRNDDTSQPLTVALSAKGNDLDFAQTVTIPAGKESVTTPFVALSNSTTEGNRTISVMASSEGYSPGTVWLLISDQTLPDAEMQKPEVAAGVEAGSQVKVMLHIKNVGAIAMPQSTPITVTLADATTTLQTDKPIAPGQTYDTWAEVKAPAVPGTYRVTAHINPDGKVTELQTMNNSSTIDVKVVAAYTFTIAAAKDKYLFGDKVVLTGSVKRTDGTAAAGIEVEPYIVYARSRTRLAAVSDAAGNFSIDYTIPAGMGGEFGFGVCTPGENLATEQGNFKVYGFSRTTTDYITNKLFVGEPFVGKIMLKNMSDLDLHNVRVACADAGAYTVSFNTVAVLPGNGTAEITYTLLSTALSKTKDWDKLVFAITTDEGARLDVTTYNYTNEHTPTLVVETNSINTTVTKNKTRLYPLVITNTGLAPTGKITVDLPKALSKFISLATPATMPSMGTGDSATVMLRFNAADFDVNIIQKGSIAINCEKGDGKQVFFNVKVVSEDKGSLKVRVQDENTIYGNKNGERPYVSGATVRLTDYNTGALVMSDVTGDDGYVLFEHLNEGYYHLNVTAEKHDSYSQNVLVSPGDVTTHLATISYQAITVNWDVEETEVEDEYEVVTKVTFETYVPVPVVDITAPDMLILKDIQPGTTTLMNVVLRNRGLIAAQDVNYYPPTAHGFTFMPMVEHTGLTLAPEQSYVIPVLVMHTEDFDNPQFAPHVKRLMPRRASSSEKNCKGKMGTDYKWPCGAGSKYSYLEKPIQWAYGNDSDCKNTTNEGVEWTPPTQMGRPGGPGGPGHNATVTINPGGEAVAKAVITLMCEVCNCVCVDPVAWLPCATSGIMVAQGSWDGVQGAKGCGNELVQWAAGMALGPAGKLSCLIKPFDPDKAPMAKASADDDSKPTVLPALLESSGRKQVMYWRYYESFFNYNAELTGAREALATEGFYDELVSALADIDFALKKMQNDGDLWDFDLSTIPATTTVDDKSQGLGAYLTSLMPNKRANVADFSLRSYVERIRNKWRKLEGMDYDSDNHPDEDKLARIVRERDNIVAQMVDMGFATLDDLMNSARKDWLLYQETASQNTCAEVKLEIKQKLVLTRQAFRGTLTIDNGSNSDMSHIMVNVNATNMETGAIATRHEMEIQVEKIEGFGGEKDGEWTLPAGKKGVATFLFIPTKYAAPENVTTYSFGGTLAFNDGATDQTRSLFPVSLQVKPSPDLDLTYFMQRDIYGDNPLTEDVIEPVVPAEFSVLIHNKGNGDANNVRMITQQPQIVDNQKGLMIDFAILSSSLNGGEKTMALSSDVATQFGTIKAGEASYATWELTSSLLGHFTQYDVSVTHVTDYGNPDLSLLDRVSIHELIHSINARIGEKTYRAWITNDYPDAFDDPDHIYFANGTDEDLVALRDATRIEALGDSKYRITVDVAQRQWFYTSVANPAGKYAKILSIKNETTGETLDADNFWTTDYTLQDGIDPLLDYRLHIADLSSGPGAVKYIVEFEPMPELRLDVVSIETVPEDDQIAEKPITELTVKFNKDIDTQTFTRDDIVLRLEGKPQTTALPITPATADNKREFKINTAALTDNGFYALQVKSENIRDAEGFMGAEGKQVRWMLFKDGLVHFNVKVLPLPECGNVDCVIEGEEGRKVTTRKAPLKAGTAAIASTAPYGRTMTFTATPNTGYKFVHWKSNADDQIVSTDEVFTTEARSTKDFAAVFQAESYKVDVNCNSAEGDIDASTGYYDYNTKLVLDARAKDNFRLVGYRINGTLKEMTPYTLTVEGPTEVEVVYRDMTPVNVLLNEGADYTPEDVEAAKVSLYRSFHKGTWNTICLPCAVDNPEAVFGQGTLVAQMTGVSGTTLMFAPVNTMEANTPYLIKPTKINSPAYAHDENPTMLYDLGVTTTQTPERGVPADSKDGYSFIGAYSVYPIATDAGNYYISSDKFYYVDAAASVNTTRFRGYFHADNGSASPISLGIGSATGITPPVSITDSRNAVYDLNGVMVRQPGESLSGLKPGVYITRDKKIIIK